MIKQKPITQPLDIAKRCLNNFWGKLEWDNGSPAHCFAMKWSADNFKRLKKLTWIQIYKEYRLACRQD